MTEVMDSANVQSPVVAVPLVSTTTTTPSAKSEMDANVQSPPTKKDNATEYAEYKGWIRKGDLHFNTLVRKSFFIGFTVCLSMMFGSMVETNNFDETYMNASQHDETYMKKPWANRLLFPIVLSVQLRSLENPGRTRFLSPYWSVLCSAETLEKDTLLNISVVILAQNMTQKDWNDVKSTLEHHTIPLEMIEKVVGGMQLAVGLDQFVKDTSEWLSDFSSKYITVLHGDHIFSQMSVLRPTNDDDAVNLRRDTYMTSLFSNHTRIAVRYFIVAVLMSIIVGLLTTVSILFIYPFLISTWKRVHSI